MSHTPTTAAIVVCGNFRFDDLSGENPEVIAMDANTTFNGASPEVGFQITFPRNATKAVKTAAIRAAINQHLGVYEPGVAPLTDIDIQISGLTI